MKQAEARERIWERLAKTARADIDNADWVHDESDNTTDQRRLLKACKQVAESIEKRIDKAHRRK